jgi:hypothetical protein
VLAVVGLLALVVGGGAGYAAQRQLEPEDRTVTDASGTISVTVPADWDRADARDGWTPPGTDTQLPALSVGTSKDWAAQGSTGEGVFVGLLSASELPEQVPHHPECGTEGRMVSNTNDGLASETVVYSDCPGGGVLVERVVQVSSNTLMWVQIRSDDRATATEVLDSVETHGI